MLSIRMSCSPFPSPYSFGTSSVVLLAQTDPLHSPPCTLKCPLFPSICTQISSVTLFEYSDLLYSFQCLFSADFSPLCMLTSHFAATSALRFPLLPSINTQIPPVPSVGAQFLWLLPSDPFQYCCAPSIPFIFPPCTPRSPPFPLYAHRIKPSAFPSMHAQTPLFPSVHGQVPIAALHPPSFALFLGSHMLSSVAIPAV